MENIMDYIDLTDKDYGTVKEVKKSRKIKFKGLSFKNISNAWKKFRLSRLTKKLEKAKDNLVNTEGKGDDYGKKKIMKKAEAIARLENKIVVLQTGEGLGSNYIKSRAIKLTNNMMSNMRYNSNNAYSVPEDKMNAIFETPEMKHAAETSSEEIKKAAFGEKEVDKIAKEEEENLAKNVQDMMNEEETIDRDDIKKAVDAGFENKAQEIVEEKENSPKTISSEEVADAVGKELEEVQSDGFKEELVSANDLRATIENEMAKVKVNKAEDEKTENIKVTKNGATKAKVNPFINDDGTYHLKREDMDEDFRVTKIEGVGQINPIKNSEKPEFKKPEKPSINGLNDDIFGEKIVEKEEKATDENVRDEIIIVPDRKESEAKENRFELSEEKANDESEKEEPEENIGFDIKGATNDDMNKLVEKASSMDELETLLAKAKIMKEEQARTKAMAEEAARKAKEAEEKRAAEEKALQESKDRLKMYLEAVEEDCNFNINKAKAAEEKANALEAEAEQNKAKSHVVMSMIQPEATNVKIEETGKRR